MADHWGEHGEGAKAGQPKSLGEQALEAVTFVRHRTTRSPGVGIILGSGLSPVGEDVSSPDVIPYREIPHFPETTVPGHPGKLLLGEIEGISVAVMAGRPHLYEGYPAPRVAFPIRVLQGLGCDVLIVTNAAGGINPLLRAGDLMLIVDHISLPRMVGFSPLGIPLEETRGQGFVSMGQAYDEVLAQQAVAASRKTGLYLKKGVYAMVAGPAYETPAETSFLRTIGADAVGMSTAPEVTAARQLGVRVLGLSCIANAVSGPGHDELSHQEVLTRVASIVPRLRTLLRQFLLDLNESAGA